MYTIPSTEALFMTRTSHITVCPVGQPDRHQSVSFQDCQVIG